MMAPASVRAGATVGTLRYDAQGHCYVDCLGEDVSLAFRGLQTDPGDWDNVVLNHLDCYDEMR